MNRIVHSTSVRRAFTLVETLVVLGVLAALVSLLLPAVQSVRESTRRVNCANHLRQLAVAVQSFETSTGYLPGPWFNAPPDSAEYSCDRGLFVQLLSHLDQVNLDEQLRARPTTFGIENADLLSQPLPLLECPSANEGPALLTGLASRFSGPTMPNLSASTTDYIGNGGYIAADPTDPARTDGPIGVQIAESGIPKESMARSSDGLSNTLLLWESIGNVVILPDSGLELAIDVAAYPNFSLLVYGPPHAIYDSHGTGSSKSYLHSWAGLRLGNLRQHYGRVINVGNRSGEPCSRHPGVANSVLLDGSVRMLSRDLTPEIGFALASARGREAIEE